MWRGWKEILHTVLNDLIFQPGVTPGHQACLGQW
jgi:hypothetical protein